MRPIALGAVAVLALAQGCGLLIDTSGLTGKADGTTIAPSVDASAADATTIGPDAGPDEVLDAGVVGLLAHYALDEVAGAEVRDSSGRGNTGTLVGDPSTVWGPGKIGNAFHGDGKTTYISLPKRPGGIELGTADFTIAAWVMVDGSLASGEPAGVDRDQQWVLTLSEGTCCQKSNYPSLRFGWWYEGFTILVADLIDGGPNDAGDYGHTFGVSQDFPEAPGTWHHVASMRRAGEIAIFVDGVYRTGKPVSFSANLNHPSDNYVIGRSRNFFFLGGIDDVRIYGRGLADAEIDDLYRQAK